MKWLKKIMVAVLILFVAIQFIRPARNKNGQIVSTDITKTVNVPDKVLNILKNSCYDCHSNNTHYPWYINIQPMGWMLARHINNGKEELNFSEFGSYTARRQISKLKGIANQIKDNDMPLFSYKMMHTNARLSQTEKALIMNWMQKTTDSISANK